MSRRVAKIPLTDIDRVAVVFGGGRSLEQVKGDADYIMNGGLYDMGSGKPVCHLKAGGVVYAKADWKDWGYSWNDGVDMNMELLPSAAARNYISCVPLLAPHSGPEARLSYPADMGGSRPRTAMGLTDTELLLYCADSPSTPENLREELRLMGARTALMLDGGGSSQCDFRGASIHSGRRVNNYIAVWLKKDKTDEPKERTGNMEKRYKVVPDVGLKIRKGPGTGYDRVGGYTKGTVITVLEESDGWGRTDKGWVSMDYLEPVEDEEAQTANGTPIFQDIIPKGRVNRPGRANPCEYITIHETGNAAAGANAKAHANYLKTVNEKVSWHYTVDDSAIYQHLPDTEDAYHAGDGSGDGNRKSIGIEICVNKGGDFEKAKENAASLVRLLMERHGIPLEKVVQHSVWSGKNCPQTIRESGSWSDFLLLCAGGVPVETDPFHAAVDKLAKAGVIDSPLYWKSGKYSTENVQLLIMKLAEAI